TIILSGIYQSTYSTHGSLRSVDLRNTTITLASFSAFLRHLNPSLFGASIVESSSDSQFNILKPPKEMKKIDLTGSSVRVVNPGVNLDHQVTQILLAVLIHYHINLDQNPLSCSCDIIPLINFVHKHVQNGTFSRSDYFFTEWKCISPQEFIGRQQLLVKEEETYCRVNVSSCPVNCLCYERTSSHVIIVDCRDTDMMSLPLSLPEGVLDLWFQRNNITRIETRNYLPRVRTLSLTSNQINQVDRDAVLQLNIIENIHLSSNNLISLPEQIQYLHLAELTITDNPFSCDCHSLWMRSWVERNKDVVLDSSVVTCNTQLGTARPLIKVPTSEFVCKNDFDAKKHVIIPATVSTLSISIVLCLVVLACIYRLELKVFLYIYVGIRPFDNKKTLQKKMFDLTIIHSSNTQEWVNTNLLPLQESNGITLIDICKDFIAGFSIQDNITCVVEQTRQVMFVLSEDFLNDERLQMAWAVSKDRIVDSGVGFMLFVTESLSVSDIPDSDMAFLMNKTHCLTTKERFIKSKLLYIMEFEKSPTDKYIEPDLRSIIERRNLNLCQAQTEKSSDIFLTYSDEGRPFACHELYPHLQEMGYDVSMPDKDFIPGVAKDENILTYLKASYHTLFIMSTVNFDDEWAVFTFREALQRSRREKYNHLIVVRNGNVHRSTIVDEELRHYLQSHVTLRSDDEDFERNLRRSIRPPFDTSFKNLTDKHTDDIVLEM
ncbi:protein toll-like, partial [Pecten maximus]|uniref:protein toll-like n=1 Tax=Pecten maximus TaxID=6579 RepID=UPI001458F89A